MTPMNTATTITNNTGKNWQGKGVPTALISHNSRRSIAKQQAAIFWQLALLELQMPWLQS
jgi:hypothetical protein